MSTRIERQVKRFVARELAVRVGRLKLDTTLFGDLRTDGDDGFDLIVAFGKEFDVSLRRFNPAKHFGPEGLFCEPVGCLYALYQAFFLRLDAHEVAGLKPIRIRDLIDAAETGEWRL